MIAGNGHGGCSGRGILRPTTTMKNVGVHNENAQSCLKSCQIESIDEGTAQKLIPNLCVPFNTSIHMPHAVHVHPQRYLQHVGISLSSLATSIVASGGYDDYIDTSDVLVYSGQGGTLIPGSKLKMAADRKLERGNLTLKNSIDEGTPVRGIRGFRETLIYDGLYFVGKYWMQQGSYGNKVFMFQLRRKVGQPKLAIKELKKSKQPSACASICAKDIFCGKEKMPTLVDINQAYLSMWISWFENEEAVMLEVSQ